MRLTGPLASVLYFALLSVTIAYGSIALGQGRIADRPAASTLNVRDVSRDADTIAFVLLDEPQRVRASLGSHPIACSTSDSQAWTCAVPAGTTGPLTVVAAPK